VPKADEIQVALFKLPFNKRQQSEFSFVATFKTITNDGYEESILLTVIQLVIVS
tara:strand:+ start:262 stop:423 length:162 start_codon:yes stop_codon:yes gene_type:complete